MNKNGLIARVKLIQRVHGWSDREVAERLGISRVFWLKIRRGERRAGMKFVSGVLTAFPELRDEAIAYLGEQDVA